MITITFTLTLAIEVDTQVPAGAKAIALNALDSALRLLDSEPGVETVTLQGLVTHHVPQCTHTPGLPL